MNRFLLLGIVLFATIFVCYVSYTPASDYQLREAIKALTRSINTLNSRVDDLDSSITVLTIRIGTPSTPQRLIYKIDNLGDDIESLGDDMGSLESEISSLESTIRRK